MNYLDEYQNCVIKPLEDLKCKIVKKYINSFLLKKYYKKMLDKIEDELLRKYQKLYELSLNKKE